MYLELSEKGGHCHEDSVHTEGSQFPGPVRHINMGILNQGHRAQSIQTEGYEPVFSTVKNLANAICFPDFTFITEDGTLVSCLSYKNELKTAKSMCCALRGFLY